MTRTLAPIAVLAPPGSPSPVAAAAATAHERRLRRLQRPATTTPASATAPAEAGGAVVSAATAPKLGKVIVDSEGLHPLRLPQGQGHDLELLRRLRAGLAAAADRRHAAGRRRRPASKLGTTKRKDGTVQVTYAGHPLYTYVADTKPGETNGNDFCSFGAQWYALLPSGEEAGG